MRPAFIAMKRPLPTDFSLPVFSMTRRPQVKFFAATVRTAPGLIVTSLNLNPCHVNGSLKRESAVVLSSRRTLGGIDRATDQKIEACDGATPLIDPLKFARRPPSDQLPSPPDFVIARAVTAFAAASIELSARGESTSPSLDNSPLRRP